MNTEVEKLRSNVCKNFTYEVCRVYSKPITTFSQNLYRVKIPVRFCTIPEEGGGGEQKHRNMIHLIFHNS